MDCPGLRVKRLTHKIIHLKIKLSKDNKCIFLNKHKHGFPFIKYEPFQISF